MAINTNLNKLKKMSLTGCAWARQLFLKKPETEIEAKSEFNFKNIKIIGSLTFLFFIVAVFLMPNDPPVEFTEKLERPGGDGGDTSVSNQSSEGSSDKSATALWGAPVMSLPRGGGGSQVNHNTSMILGTKSGNAKTQLRAGQRISLRILDKVIISQDPVPVLAEMLFDSVSDSGLRLPAGTRFYGEASFQKGAERAQIRFRQLSLPSGQIRQVSGLALGKDGQPGISGRMFSDGVKNTAGQLITTFVAGLAGGSIETDVLGQSRGGIENGLLAAVSATAKGRAQDYGEKLKAEREWIEIQDGTECDAVLNESFNLQSGTTGGEQ